MAMTGLANFLLSFGFNFLVALVVVRSIYYPTTRNKSYVFTFLAFNTVIYFVLCTRRSNSSAPIAARNCRPIWKAHRAEDQTSCRWPTGLCARYGQLEDRL